MVGAFCTHNSICLKVLLTLQLGISKMLKKPYFNLFGKKYLSFHVFSPKKNFQELQLHQTLILFNEFLPQVKVIAFSTKVIFKKVFAFNFICAFVFSKKYAMTNVHKNWKSALIFIISHIADTFLRY